MRNSKKREIVFRKLFIDLIYDNMAMEDEAVFSKKEMMERYKAQLDSLIKEGLHKEIVLPKKYGQN